MQSDSQDTITFYKAKLYEALFNTVLPERTGEKETKRKTGRVRISPERTGEKETKRKTGRVDMSGNLTIYTF